MNELNMTEEEEFSIDSIAPGKIILSGEHAVCYNSQAISCAINLTTNTSFSFHIKKQTEDVGYFISLTLTNLDTKFLLCQHEVNFIKEFIQCLQEKMNDVPLLELISNTHVARFLNMINYEADTSSKTAALHFIFLFNLVLAYAVLSFKTEKNLNIFESLLQTSYINIQVCSEIPCGSGLGSSAAYNTSLCSSLLTFTERIFKECYPNYLDTLIKLSLIGEKLFHEKPSGVDNITSVLGGIVLFKSISSYENISLQDNFLLNQMQLYLIDTKVRRNTKEFIEKVSSFKSTFPDVFKQHINLISSIVEEISLMLKNGDEGVSIDHFNELIALNHAQLKEIQVSCESIEKIVEVFNSNNIPAKITGAGGGGFVLVFVTFDNEDKFNNLVKENEFAIIRVKLNEIGAHIITKSP